MPALKIDPSLLLRSEDKSVPGTEEYSFKYTATSPASRTSDLADLTTEKAAEFASRLQTFLQAFEYSELSRLMRCDHSSSPIANSSRNFLRKDITTLEGVHLHPHEAVIIKFFMLGEAINREDLEAAFKKAGVELLEEGKKLEIFRETSDGKISTNNLILCAHHLRDDCPLYFFADTPEYLESNIGPSRVYTGTDSYFLNAKLQTYQGVEGNVVEMGAGSGFQLLTLLKLNPDISRAIGVEIDARARNVSIFNAFLNGEGARFSVVTDEAELRSALGNEKISLGFSNPPFIPAPRIVHGYDAKGEKALDLDLREFFPSSGWGGQDGLRITREFVTTLEALLEPEGEILLYSQFTGTHKGPQQVYNLAGDAGFERVSFEKFPAPWRGYDLTTTQWAQYVSRHTKDLHPHLPSDAESWIYGATISMLQNQGITHLHSGFILLRKGETSALVSGPANEDSLQLYSALEGSVSVLKSLSGMIPRQDLVQPPGIGQGGFYVPPSPLISRTEKTTHRRNSILTRKLNCRDDEYWLVIKERPEGFSYLVKDNQNAVVEEGPVKESNHALTARYQELLTHITTYPAIELLRHWRVEGVRIFKASELNQILGSTFTGELLVEVIPSGNCIKISRWETPPSFRNEWSRSGTMEITIEEPQHPSKIASYGIYSLEGLRLLSALKKYYPATSF